MAGFVQIVEFETSRIDEVKMLGEKFTSERQSSDRPYTVTVTLTSDRDRPNHYLNIVEFPSYDVAMENSNRPETSDFAARMQELCDAPVKYHNLDITQTYEFS